MRQPESFLKLTEHDDLSRATSRIEHALLVWLDAAARATVTGGAAGGFLPAMESP